MMKKFENVKIYSSLEPQLSVNALTVLEKRYLARNDKGDIIESPKGLFERVAKFVALADFFYGGTDDDVNQVATEFYDMMAEMFFLPNSPTLMNAGRPLGQLSACFVLPVEDSMEGIFDALKNMALIHKSGGGTGFSFSRLRPKNDVVSSTAGVSSGPVSFMNIFNTATETVKQGGTRRGANMAILNVDHPDILEFIKSKSEETSLTNFNISVALTDSFMEAARRREDYYLINPRNGTPSGKLNAGDVYDLIIDMAWKNGEPGIVFIDRINEFNPLKKIGLIESTNPCGEQPLLPYESCNLGSINLSKVVKEKDGRPEIDFELLKKITHRAVHFLDNVIDMNNYPLKEIEKKTKMNRKIGLGVMGYADMLIKLNIAYDSHEAIEVAESVMSFIQRESKIKSAELAINRGAFPTFEKSVYAEKGESPLRNATTTTIAPTGTISILADTSSGIEPIFALAYVRNVMDNDRLLEVNPQFQDALRNFFSDDEIDSIMDKVAVHGSVRDIEEVPESIKRVFVTAHDISPLWHIKTQAVFQKYVDNAVSKTVNFPNSATKEDIREVYDLAYELGCKGVTVYRDGSRDNQVLQKPASGEGKKAEDERASKVETKIPRPRHEVTWGTTRKMNTGCGSLYVTINEDEKGIFEVFATMGKGGGCAASQTEAIGRLISLALRSGIDKDQIVKQLKGVRCPNQIWEKGGRIYSCSDAIAKAIERYSGVLDITTNLKSERAQIIAETNGRDSDSIMTGVCPDCHGPLEFESGCSVCRSCGFSRCG
ncbi:MAG: Ribonucleoside-diphosphate reductase NrdZ [Spirochaetes bacterium ADurb.Bin218]|jgi:ribonucleoside-diphosphate reductase alpha chain|nr:MAG: Ribonucleoside-diphosphate reductase NrdZ [Spirochaetes bacterium ADurb.Bin218]HOQ12886.1 vitamin B12-dependent ribonucleotide reductase [Spirochaetota bacterium]HOV09601.1 vitamin B12-dependent ribonucleotide reductase [Spirochaetota bacterium]HPX91778.1 vitamin B12-dependent ribonucleotide reductase [Spirochaetota bacterium]HRS61796.1 vitamin B12-dependent ribonucleotide reductase [Spirochaetota bacterium]